MVKKIKSEATSKATPKAGATEAGPAGKSRKSSRLGSAALMDNQLANSVKDSAQQIWLAGMGAFSKVQEEGTKAFETLVKEGLTLQRKTQGLAEDKINEVTGRMTAMAGSVSAKAGQNWDKLEAIFEQRTAKAMNKLGVPTAKDVEALVKRVDELAAAVAKLARATPAAEPTAARKPRPARKPKAAVLAEPAAEPAPAPAAAPAKRPRARKAASAKAGAA